MSRSSRRLNKQAGRYMGETTVTADHKKKRNSYFGNSLISNQTVIDRRIDKTDKEG